MAVNAVLALVPRVSAYFCAEGEGRADDLLAGRNLVVHGACVSIIHGDAEVAHGAIECIIDAGRSGAFRGLGKAEGRR